MTETHAQIMTKAEVLVTSIANKLLAFWMEQKNLNPSIELSALLHEIESKMAYETVRQLGLARMHKEKSCWYCDEPSVWKGRIDRQRGLRNGTTMTPLCKKHHKSIVLV